MAAATRPMTQPDDGRTLRAAASRAGAARGTGTGRVHWRRSRSQRGGQSRPARLGALGHKAVTFRHVAFVGKQTKHQ